VKDLASHKLFDWLLSLGRPIGNVVQVGANIGQELPAFDRYGVEWAVMIEPLEAAFQRLAEASAGNPRRFPVQALCSDEEGRKQVFWVATNEGQSSSMMRPDRHLEQYPKIKFPNAIKLFSTTLDGLMARTTLQHPELADVRFDTLLIDVQGAELKVLRGASGLLGQVRQIIAEVGGDLYEGAPSLEEVQAHLGPLGFRLNTVKLGSHGSGDALFLKRDG
jgi:FkbM family methyltransferase